MGASPALQDGFGADLGLARGSGDAAGRPALLVGPL